MSANSHLLKTLFTFQDEIKYPTTLPIQSLFCIFAKKRAIALADYLLNEKGNLIVNRLEEVSQALKKHGFIAYPEGVDEGEITQHFLTIIDFFKKHPRLFIQVGLPLATREIEEQIRITLNIDRPLIDRDISWAILSALLCPLRQSIGSCFATAPAILIQKEYPEQCLKDLQSMVSTGVLKRVIAGVEFSVPISPTPGLSELKREINFDEDIAMLPVFTQALSAAGVLSTTHSMEEILSLLHPYFGMKISLLDLLEKVIREHFSISEETLDAYRSSLINPHFQVKEFHKIEEMLAAVNRAKLHFVAFSDHLLLKVWEFTIASLADVKMEFSRWNLFSSLGLHPQEKGGIGAIVYHLLETKLNETNEKLSSFQQEYEIIFDQVRATESLMRNVSSESDARRLKMEHHSRSYHLHACLEMRDKYAALAERISNFFPFFIETLNNFFPEYFQEIFDPEMYEIKANSLDDSPAGFRLAYKHGRSHASTWTFIYTKEEWLRTLRDFFLSIESRVRSQFDAENEADLFSEIFTAIIQHLNDPEFLKTAFLRMAKAHHITLHKKELEDLENFDKKPWAYSSGGTILTLLKTYFRTEGNITEMTRWVESPTDLCVFLIDTLKDLPPRIMNLFVKNADKRMLITSPTHAFSLLPGKKMYREGWEHSGFTYTWVRDEIILPQQRFYHSCLISSEEQLFFIDELSKRLSLLQAHQLRKLFIPTTYSINAANFYQMMRQEHPYISSFLLEALIFEALPIQSDPKKITPLLDEWQIEQKYPIELPMTRKDLHQFFVKKLIEKHQSIYFDHNIHEEVQRKMEKWGLAPPLPFIFGDSNWSEIFFFAFLVNPATEEFELWRVDSQGIQGLPMKEWKIWLDGSHKTPWGIFSHPYQYMI